MADITHAGGAPGRTVAQPAHWIGAGLSLALIAGVGFWGYQLVARDVSVIPVVAALEGPLKVVPDSEGGRPAEHQGYAVNDVAGQGTAAAPSDQVALAPDGVGLSAEDLPLEQMADTTPVAREDFAPVDEFQYVSSSAGFSQTTALADASAASAPVSAEAVEASLQNLRDGAAAAEARAAEIPEEVQEVAAVLTPAPEVPQITGGLARSLRPVARTLAVQPTPAVARDTDPDVAAVVAAVATAPEPSELDLDPVTLAAGTQLAQVGALDSPDIARQEWDRLAGRFGVLFSDKLRVIQPVENNGRTLYRLRVAGFDGLADARRFCAVIKAGRTDCIPVSHK